MAYVITDRCAPLKDQSCTEVCPVDCIHPSEFSDGPEAFHAASQLYIDPNVCIDCAACVPVCPVDAIAFASDLPADDLRFIEINRAYFDRDGAS